jgi:hypothetical protein
MITAVMSEGSAESQRGGGTRAAPVSFFDSVINANIGSNAPRCAFHSSLFRDIIENSMIAQRTGMGGG